MLVSAGGSQDDSRQGRLSDVDHEVTCRIALLYLLRQLQRHWLATTAPAAADAADAETQPSAVHQTS